MCGSLRARIYGTVAVRALSSVRITGHSGHSTFRQTFFQTLDVEMRMQSLKRYIPVVLALAASGAAWAQDPPEKSAASHLAGVLVNDARDALRDTALPPDAAAAQATVLLQFATKLD